MTEFADLDVRDVDAVAADRDALVDRVHEHAGRVAYELAKLEGGDYGRRTFDTDAGAWTVKYEAGELEFLLFEPKRGSDTYVVSTKQPPEPDDLATALADYPAFVAAFNDYVDSLDGVLDDVSADFPEPASTDDVVAQRDRVLDVVADACDRMAAELHRYEGTDWGTFTERVDGVRWELKWERDGASYLRAGGENGVYLLSQYEPPSAADVREYAPAFRAFVEAYNDHVRALELDLREIEL